MLASWRTVGVGPWEPSELPQPVVVAALPE